MEKERFPLREIAGDYRVSTANMDRLVAVAMGCPGVLGARLSGAGLGGALIVLGREGFSEVLDPLLRCGLLRASGKGVPQDPHRPLAGGGNSIDHEAADSLCHTGQWE